MVVDLTALCKAIIMPTTLPYNEYEQLFKVFNSIYPLSDEIRVAIISNSHIINIKKRGKLLRAGERSNTIYFIVKGAIRIYYLDRKGKETNTWFLLDNELVISIFSFYTGQPSFEYIETLEDCILISLKREDLEALYLKHMEFNFLGRKLTESYHMHNEIRANELRMLNARERHENLLDRNPQLFQRVSLGHIASYLGISQETLSRIRQQK